MVKPCTLFFLSFLAFCNVSYSQNSYLRIATYVGIVHPTVTYSSDKPQYNFKDYYVGGMPVGVNVWKNPKVGFSLEIVPYVKAENGSSKMNNLLLHPGVLISLGHGFTFAGRAAFETAGRYGFTPVFNKIVKKNKNSGYFVALPLPLRFGNDKPASFTIGFQFGIIF